MAKQPEVAAKDLATLSRQLHQARTNPGSAGVLGLGRQRSVSNLATKKSKSKLNPSRSDKRQPPPPAPAITASLADDLEEMLSVSKKDKGGKRSAASSPPSERTDGAGGAGAGAAPAGDGVGVNEGEDVRMEGDEDAEKRLRIRSPKKKPRSELPRVDGQEVSAGAGEGVGLELLGLGLGQQVAPGVDSVKKAAVEKDEQQGADDVMMMAEVDDGAAAAEFIRTLTGLYEAIAVVRAYMDILDFTKLTIADVGEVNDHLLNVQSTWSGLFRRWKKKNAAGNKSTVMIEGVD